MKIARAVTPQTATSATPVGTAAPTRAADAASAAAVNLQHMPVEIGLQIVEYLPPKTRAKFAKVSHTCHDWVERWPNLVPPDAQLRPGESRRAFWVRDFQMHSDFGQMRLLQAMDETRDAADFATPLYDADARLFHSTVYRSEEYGFHLIYQHVSDKWRTCFSGPWFYLPRGSRVAGQLNGSDGRIFETRACRDGRLIPYSPSGHMPDDAYVVRVEHMQGGGIRAETPDGKRTTLPYLKKAEANAVLRAMTFKPIPSNYRPMCLARLDDGRFLYLDTPTTGFTGRRRAFFGVPGDMRFSHNVYPRENNDMSQCTMLRTDYGSLHATSLQMTDPDHPRTWRLRCIGGWFETPDNQKFTIEFLNTEHIRALLPSLGIDIDEGNTQQLVPEAFELPEPSPALESEYPSAGPSA